MVQVVLVVGKEVATKVTPLPTHTRHQVKGHRPEADRQSGGQQRLG